MEPSKMLSGLVTTWMANVASVGGFPEHLDSGSKCLRSQNRTLLLGQCGDPLRNKGWTCYQCVREKGAHNSDCF
jgi:hypothetical protein